MKNVQSQVKTISGWHEAKLFYALSALALGALLLYISFIGKTVFTLVEDKNLESENRALSAEISELELQTLALNDSISIEKAYSLGFVSAKSAEYVAPSLQLTQR